MKQKIGEKNCRIILISLSLILFGCGNNIVNKRDLLSVDRNIFPFDSMYSIYIPRSICDSVEFGEEEFGFYSYSFFSKKDNLIGLKIKYELEQYPYQMPNVIKKRMDAETEKIVRYHKGKKIISADSVQNSDVKVGVIESTENLSNTYIKTTSLYFLSANRDKWYSINITTDSSYTGLRLADSIKSIIRSIKFL